jgi:hypothetical protein
MNKSELTDFATRYAAAWSSQNSEQLASLYSENGSLIVNRKVIMMRRSTSAR